MAPTWLADLDVVEIKEERGVYQLTISPDISYGDTYLDKAGRDALYIRLREGNSPVAIVAHLDGGTSTILEVSPSVPPVDAADMEKEFIQCSWLESVRLATDEVTITWITTEAADVRVAVSLVDDG